MLLLPYDPQNTKDRVECGILVSMELPSALRGFLLDNLILATFFRAWVGSQTEVSI
jgi:hypothetical protein